ncbi:hypothetical protein [Blastococcus haudaquaticus]|uniref:PH domain-containing protein n=1 Tax=Blastococcus haudaquaticus TaxID=1938745 RepID=A0A286GIC9_9ACTN|nr:hypothetical protein [Blastococcus haudaquaticus]SOD95260.1 hypothetical protein SAMN06272739_1152 [Blastococcus haudaquaticus]
MTTTDEPLAIRQPRWVRLVGPAFLAVWGSAFLFSDDGWGNFRVPGLVIAVVAVAFVGRMLFWSAIGTDDGRLTVRNAWSTRTFTRDEIDGVEVDRAAGRGWAVWLRLADGGRHSLDVTQAPFLGPFRATLERQADAVRAWLDGRPHAFL